MKLQSLNAVFIRREIHIETYRVLKPDVDVHKVPLYDEDFMEVTGPREHHVFVRELQEADGVMFLCPKCYQENGGDVGTHSVVCWFVGKVPDDAEPKPGRWTPQGTGLHDLTFVPTRERSNSVLLTGEHGCHWHGFVTNGDAS